MSTASPAPGGQRTRTFKGKSSQDCVTCRNRHVKCDETRPICNNCRRLNRVCVQRDGSSADLRGQAGASATFCTLTTAPVRAAGSTVAAATNAATAGSADVTDATGTVEDSQMVESTPGDQREEANTESQDKTLLSHSFLDPKWTLRKTTLYHDTPSSINPQGAINKTDSSSTTLTQSLQHEAASNTTTPGPITTGRKRPFSVISDPPFPTHEPTMTSNKSPTSTKQSNEAMKDDTQRTVGSTTSPGTVSQTSTMTNATNNNSTSPLGQSTINSSNEIKHRAARLINAPLSRTSRAGNSFSEISRIESTSETTTMSNSNTSTSAAMSTPNSNGDTTQGSTTQSSSTQSGTTQSTNTQNITKSKSSTMTNGNTSESSTYAQVTVAPNPSSIATTAPITAVYPALGIAQPQPHYHTPLSLASTRTNAPPGSNFTPLRPIHNWVPPRPAIISRTERSAAEIADDIADEEVRKAEKMTEAERKEAEMRMLREAAERAEKAAEVEKARALGDRVLEWREGGSGKK